MNVLPHERLLRAFRDDRKNVAVADVIVDVADLNDLECHDVVRLERWTENPPAQGTKLELRLGEKLVARGTFVEVAGRRGIRITELHGR